MNTVLIIPCYNEEKTISRIVSKAYKYVDLVIVVDDQSTDKTGTLAFFSGAKVCKTQGKHGAGVAIRTGIKQALISGAKYILIMDGDGQHNPDDLPRLLEALRQYEVVMFTRFNSSSQIPRYRRFGISVINLAYNLFAKQKLTDSQCGYRGFRSYVLCKFPVTEDGFAYSTEILIKARKYNFTMAELPCKAIYYDNYSQNSTLNPVKHGLDVLWRTIKWRIKEEIL